MEEEEEEEEVSDMTEDEIHNSTCVDLRTECKKHELSTRGRKSVLQQRLTQRLCQL